jgi:hypothetical protein
MKKGLLGWQDAEMAAMGGGLGRRGSPPHTATPSIGFGLARADMLASQGSKVGSRQPKSYTPHSLHPLPPLPLPSPLQPRCLATAPSTTSSLAARWAAT